MSYEKMIMARPKKHDFSDKTKTTLRLQAANTCSNPDCRVMVFGPDQRDQNKFTNIGIAAHIWGAATDGPRPNTSLSASEISHIDNALWLCYPCSKLIDDNEDLYPVELLKEWKKNSELRIYSNINKRLYTENEAETKVAQKMLQSIGLDVPHVLNASFDSYAESLKATVHHLDPRLELGFSYIDGTCHYNLRSISQDSSPTISFAPRDALDFAEKYRNWSEHGIGFETKISNIESDSKGLEYVMPRTRDNLILGIGNAQSMPVFMQMTDIEDNVLVDLRGDAYFGEKTFSIKVYSFDGILEFHMDKYDPVKSNNQIHLKLNLDNWKSTPILELLHFNKIHRLYRKLTQIKEIKLFLTIGDSDERILSLPFVDDVVNDIYRNLSYTNTLRKIDKIINKGIIFNKEYGVSAEYLTYLEKFYEHIKPLETSELYQQDIIFEGDEPLDETMFKEGAEITFTNSVQVKNIDFYGEVIDEVLYVRSHFINPKFLIEKLDSESGFKNKITLTIESGRGNFVKEVAFTPFDQQPIRSLNITGT